LTNPWLVPGRVGRGDLKTHGKTLHPFKKRSGS
jgi:hypothetical protein